MIYAGIAFGPAAGFLIGWLMYLSRLSAFGAIAAIMLDYSTGTVYLATFSAIARMLTYASTCAALIVLRRRDGPAPISIPLGPLWSVLAVVCTFLALGTTTGTALRDVSIAVAAGFAFQIANRRWTRPHTVLS